ncbi:MAG: alkaline phosphatase D family protein [Pseudomonadales bacterium]|jgi:alkaline phosphatase D
MKRRYLCKLRNHWLTVALLLVSPVMLANQSSVGESSLDTVTRIAFGSCAEPKESYGIFDVIVADEPDVFLFLGDNVYADDESDDPELRSLRAAYASLAQSSEFKHLKARVPLYATWDDHDYGLNDAGGDWPHKWAAEALFETFWAIPSDDPSTARPGIYREVRFGEPGKSVQLILLDTRFFRTALRKPIIPPSNGRYEPTDDPNQSMLGEAQWAWLEEVLTQPADLRLIASSVQFLAEGHAWEAWRLLPMEQRRLMTLLSQAQGSILILSGDRHMAGIYYDNQRSEAPLLEITASSLNLPLSSILSELSNEPGPYRLGQPFYDANYGMLEIDWPARRVFASIKNGEGDTVRSVEFKLSPLPSD